MEVRAVVSFDDKTVTDATAQNNRQHATQESIKKATWYAFFAVTIYALISLGIWCQMIRQNRIASETLRQSTESFRIDERAWIEIEAINLQKVDPGPPIGFVYGVQAKNFGKTVARDIVLKRVTALDGNIGPINARSIQNAQDNLLRDQPGEPSPVPSLPMPKSLAPGTPVYIPFTIGGSAPQTYGQGSKQITMYNYLIGRFDYNDAFGIPHWLKFCVVIRDTSGKLGYCETGNDEDRNPELPQS
jgi:hypothetical protein